MADTDQLEVAIGTGLDLEHYPREIVLTGIEQSPAMLELARRRAEQNGVTGNKTAPAPFVHDSHTAR